MLPVNKEAPSSAFFARRACVLAHGLYALQGAAGLDMLRKDLLLAGFVDAASSAPVLATPEASAVTVRLVEEDSA